MSTAAAFLSKGTEPAGKTCYFVKVLFCTKIIALSLLILKLDNVMFMHKKNRLQL